MLIIVSKELLYPYKETSTTASVTAADGRLQGGSMITPVREGNAFYRISWSAMNMISKIGFELIQYPTLFFCIKTPSHETPVFLPYSDCTIS